MGHKEELQIQYKIQPSTPDEVCRVCQQFYDGNCRAHSFPHSEAERKAREGDYGMECDPPTLKKTRMERYSVKYRIHPTNP